MSRAYRNSSNVPLDAIIKRLHELSDAVVGGRKTQAQEFVMRVPAECDHDADLVLAEAAVRLDALRKYNAELQAENDNLRKANQDCVAWEKACEANLDRALARAEKLRQVGNQVINYNANPQQWADAIEDSSEAWLLRKQSEVVVEFGDFATKAFPYFLKYGVRIEASKYAARLRQQADRMEADMVEDHG